MRRLVGVVVAGALLVLAPAAWANRETYSIGRLNCDQNSPTCTETAFPYTYDGHYTGHDEPSALFYSNTAGSGNNQVYTLTLPSDPPTAPNQSGTGGTDNFQLHPAFWFGMAMCDDQSAPNPGGSRLAGPNVPCTPDSDSNIYTGTKPTKKGGTNYLGQHPGMAYMEMQFYPPGWVLWPAGDSCDAKQWCAALNVDQLNANMNQGSQVIGAGNFGTPNNSACLHSVGIEPFNFAFITHNGVAQGPANPVDATLATYTPSSKQDLMMNSGDTLKVAMKDTPDGFQVVIDDLTTGQSGSMTASAANGFGHVVFDPTASTCTVSHEAFHPGYATTGENTRTVWAAHSYNVAFSDEIGHFEFCNAVSDQGSDCTKPGVDDPGGLDSDDSGGNGYCFAPPYSNPFNTTFVKVGGCLGTESDFDGAPYQTVWPGSTTNAAHEAQYFPTPIRFTSPTFTSAAGTSGQTYGSVAFETDLARIEIPQNSPDNNCDRSTGSGCVNPPLGPNGQSVFYPIYSTATVGGSCTWQVGGAHIAGSTNTFGGTSTSEYGSLLKLDYPEPTGVIYRYNDFQNVVSPNPC